MIAAEINTFAGTVQCPAINPTTSSVCLSSNAEHLSSFHQPIAATGISSFPVIFGAPRDIVTASSTGVAPNIHSYPTVELITTSISSSSRNDASDYSNILPPDTNTINSRLASMQTQFPLMSSPLSSLVIEPKSERTAGGHALYAAVGGLVASLLIVIAVIIIILFPIYFIRKRKQKIVKSNKKSFEPSNTHCNACKLVDFFSSDVRI